ncbi:MAG: hypothetical protein AAF771_00960 [Pseudomonadota bacterium]
MSDAAERRLAALRLLKGLEDHKLAQAAQLHQQRQAAAQALQDEIDTLMTRVDQEIEAADADSVPYLPMFVRASQKIAADRRASQAKLADQARRSEAEFGAIYRRVTVIGLAADKAAADQAARRARSERAKALEGMIARYDRDTRNRP